MRSALVIATFTLFNVFRLAGYVHEPRLASSAIHRVIGEPARVEASVQPGELKVVTWNIQYGARFDRVLEAMRRVDADVYLLQEADVFCRRSHNRNVVKDLADAIGANWVFAGEFQEIGESTGGVPALTGQAILSRYPIVDASVVPFTSQAWLRWHLNPWQPRRGGRIVLQAQTAGFRVYNAHLESGQHDRLRQQQLDDILAMDATDYASSSPSLLAGDFNNGPIARSSLFQTITAAHFVNALTTTASSQMTCVHRRYPIDWIFVRHLLPTAGQVLQVDGASDHYPVIATFRREL